MTEQAIVKRRATGVMLGHYPYHYCGLCGKQIHWITTARWKKMPCELQLQQGNGKMTLVTNDGRVIVKAGPDVCGYEPHFGHCEEYKKLKKPNGGNNG